MIINQQVKIIGLLNIRTKKVDKYSFLNTLKEKLKW